MRRRQFGVLFISALLSSTLADRALAEELQIAPAAEKLLNDFMNALLIADLDESAKAALAFVHPSLMNNEKTDLSADLRRFSHKKAHDNAKFYAAPVQITRTRPTGMSGIGFGPTAEKGRVVDYFIAKKPGINGMPAPVKIFFPEGDKPPKISYMGSI